MVEHHVAGLEVAIEEEVAIGIAVIGEILGEEPEISLELQFMKVELGGFEEAILEIVQVEEYAVDIELSLWITIGEIEAARTANLNIRQFADGALQQFLLFQGIAAACFSPTPNGIEERSRTEVGLKISKLVIAGSQHLRYG